MSALPPGLSIAAVERDTGLSKDTLRVWERRYGFPSPERDAQGERLYPAAQVERLRLIKRLLDAGHRPGRVVALPLEELQRQVEAVAATPVPECKGPESEDLPELMDKVFAHDVEGLRRHLTQRVAYLGLHRFISEVVGPFNRMIGDAWLQGRIQIFEEHAYTESLQVVLRHALHSLPAASPQARPLALLSTFPGEQHGLGLLMAECLLRMEGAPCVSLGVQTPIWDLVLAAEAHAVDLVVLSFSGVMNPNTVIEGLQELRSKLPLSVEIWAGGSAPVIQRRPVEGVRPMAELQQIAPALADWRAQRGIGS